MEEQTQSSEAGTVIVMLDNQCVSPCYCFATDRREVRSMSPEVLDEVVEWVSQFQPSPPSMLYMVGTPRVLEEGVQQVLEDIADRVICAPMSRAEQEQAGLPFAQTQMVVFPSLADFERDNGILGGRPCVVHLGPQEISRWSRTVKAQTTEARLRFRPKNLHEWDRSHLEAYRDQLLELETLQYHLGRAGISVSWEFRSASRCPARRTLAAIGPDGLCYPCPTFYYAKQNGLGAIRSLPRDRVFLPDSGQRCRLCQSEHCEACLFYESDHVRRGEVAVCELPTRIKDTTLLNPTFTDINRSGSSWLGTLLTIRNTAWAVRQRRLTSAIIMKVRRWPSRPSRSRALYYRLIHSTFVVHWIKPPLSFRNSPFIVHSRQCATCVRDGLPAIREYRNVFFVPNLQAVYYDNGGLIHSSVSKGGLGGLLPSSVSKGDTGSNHAVTLPECIDRQQLEHSPVIDRAFFGGVAFPHFGHFLLESLSRLWPFALSSMAQELCDCDILYWAPNAKPGASFTKLGKLILTSLGIEPNVRILHQPVFVRKMVIPNQAITLDVEVYPVLRTLLKTAGDRIACMYGLSRKEEDQERVYLSRSKLRGSQRICINECPKCQEKFCL